MKPRLMFVVNVDWFFLSHRLPIALAARDAGFDVHVATTLTGPAEAIEAHGLTLHRLDLDRQSASPVSAFRYLLSLYGLFRSEHPDIVHLVTIKPLLLGGLAARLARVRQVVAAISGLGFVFTAQGAGAWVRRMMVASLYRFALARPRVRIIVQNRADQALLEQHAGIRAAQCVLIRGSGVALDEWPVEPPAMGRPMVLMAARLLVDKGVGEFAEAARLLRGHRDARFVLVGDVDPGNPTSLSHELLASWVGEGLVEWWGHRTDMPQVLPMAQIVVLPSYREGLPKVLIEAAASARAVVTTDVPGCRDAIEAGKTGLMVPARDATALAGAIRQLLDDPGRAVAMGREGRLLAERAFDVRQVAARHLEIYREGVRLT